MGKPACYADAPLETNVSCADRSEPFKRVLEHIDENDGFTRVVGNFERCHGCGERINGVPVPATKGVSKISGKRGYFGG